MTDLAALQRELQDEMERRDADRPGNRNLGRVVSCNGARATISAIVENGATELTELWSVGRLISITVGENRVVAGSYSMEMDNHHWVEQGKSAFLVEVELLGEVRKNEEGRDIFSTGISTYPYLGAIAHRIRARDLALVYDHGDRETTSVGKLTQDETIDATIHIPSMLSKHFAVVGSTGVGKSTAVSLLLNKAVECDPKLRVLILDPHNEFASAFPDKAVVIDTDTLDLPFWLMRLEEFSEVLFRGRSPIADEVDILRDLIPEAKKAFKGSDSTLMRRQSDRNSFTADTPVPYRIADLLALIDDRIGRLEGRSEKPALRSLKMRIMSAINDPRYHFMFLNNTIQDTIVETIAHIFRVPGNGKPISTFQLSGIPSEVVNSVVSILCRMAFEIGLWANGSIHMLVVCEEAHRYVPADPTLGFIPTRQAIARIAKEGRKYGVSLGIITQRPGELDQTILSQCSTLFAMRLSNERDQEIIRSAIPNSSISTTNFISSIGNGEAIAFGEAIAVPMRMRFERVTRLPMASTLATKEEDETPDTLDLRSVVTRMRSVSGGEFNPAQSPFGGRGMSSYEPTLSEEPASFPPAERLRQSGYVDEQEADVFAADKNAELRSAMARERRIDPMTMAARPDPRTGDAGASLRSPSYPSSEQHGEDRTQRLASSDNPLRREGFNSLRESLLKKPLSSLRKD